MDDPKTVGRYEVTRRLGRGGMGSVYLARDPLIDRQLAIKILSDTFDTAARDRFTREARAAGRLHHANIVTIFDVGEDAGRPFIAMEYVPGETLAALIRRVPALPLVELLALVEDACVGLAFAHRAGIVHLDVKPENLMRSADGRLKVLDFGIARVVESDDTHTRSVLGTLSYMSPEQLTGGALDRRSDIFGLGCVLYEVVAGRPAFGGTVGDAVSRIGGGSVASLASIVPDVHPGLVRITDRAMALAPADRYDDLDAFREEIAAVRRDIVTTASHGTRALPPDAATARHDSDRTTRAEGAADRVPPPAVAGAGSTHRTVLAVLGAIAVVAAVGIGAWLLGGTPAPPAGDSAPGAQSAAANRAGGAGTPTPPPVTPEPAAQGAGTEQVPRVPAERDGQQTAGRSGRRSASPPPNGAAARGRAMTASPEHAPAPAATDPARGAPPPPSTATTSGVATPPAPIDVPRGRIGGDVAVGMPISEGLGRPPAAAGGGPEPPPDEAVRAVLAAYSAAYAARDMAALRRIYPTQPPDQAKALAGIFERATSYRLDVRVGAIRIDGATAIAECDVTHEPDMRDGGVSRTTQRARFHFRQQGRAWVIARIEYDPSR